jgi:hypothetical protein
MAKAGIVYVGTADGLATYSDPGGTGNWRRRWQTLEGRAIRAILAIDDRTLVVAPGAVALGLLAGKEEVLLAAIAGGTSLVRSEDNGASWQPAAVDGGLRGGVTVIVPSSYHMDFVWAGTDAGQLLRSDDRGRSWREVGAEPAAIRSLAVVRVASTA